MIWDLKFSHQNSVVYRTSAVNALVINASLTVARKNIQYIRIHIQYPHLMRLIQCETRLDVTSLLALQLKTTLLGHFFTSYIVVPGVSLTTSLVQKAIFLHFMTVTCDKSGTKSYLLTIYVFHLRLLFYKFLLLMQDRSLCNGCPYNSHGHYRGGGRTRLKPF